MSINRFVFSGRLTKDIELKKTSSGTSVATFSLAVDRMKKEDGADFPNIVVWKQQAEFLSKYARKGTKVIMEGRVQTRSYDGQNGKVFVTEFIADKVEIAESKKEESKQEVEWEHKSNNPSINGEQIQPDDLPFY